MIQTWVEKEARKILCRDNHSKNAFILETGYGPSSLPHLGTAMEVVRTCMVAKFLRTLTSKKVIVVSFVDDMDGMRDVPPNLPNQELLKDFIN